MGSQVAVAEVAVVPTFKGFRSSVSKETDGSAKTAAQGFSRVFSKTGVETGKTVGTGFKRAFEQSAQGASAKVTKQLEGDVAKASRALSAARLKEQDSIGKVRLAQAQLNEANGKYASGSSQVIRAQERLASASRQLETAHEGTERATDDLKRSQGELARAADRAGDELSEAGRKGVTGFRDNVVGGVKGFAGPLIAAFAALGIGNIVADAFRGASDFVKQSIDLASSLSESVNAVQVSYGEAADGILKLGEDSAKTFGLSKLDLNSYATQFSAFVSTIAGSGGDVAGTFETLVGRGTDFASVMDVDVSEALRLFQSGLAGETEPLRQYGIDLSAAAVQAYALANGIGDGSSELTEAQKVQARYGSLLEQTNKVAGDFANTQGSLANINRTNKATWEDLQAQIGDDFLPVATELATIVRDDVLPVIAQLAEEQGPELAEAFADVLPELTDLVKDLLPLLPELIEDSIDVLPVMIELLRLIAPLFTEVKGGGFEVLQMFSAFFGLLSGDSSIEDFRGELLAMEGPFGALLRWVDGVGGAFNTLSIMAPIYWEVIKTVVKSKIDEVITFIQDIPGRALAALGDLTDDLVQSGRDLIGGFLRGLTSAPVDATMSGIMRQVGDYFPHSPAKKGPFSGSGWTQLERSGEAFWDQWLGGMGGGEPPFPALPKFPGSGGSGGAAAPGVAARGGVTQINNYAHQDPQVAAGLAKSQLDSLLRSA